MSILDTRKTYCISRTRMAQSLIDFMYGAACGVMLATMFFLGV